MKIYKWKGHTIWRFDFHYTDNQSYNRGYKDLKAYFIGTKNDFEEMRKSQEFGMGFSCWNISKRHASEKEYENDYYWDKI